MSTPQKDVAAAIERLSNAAGELTAIAELPWQVGSVVVWPHNRARWVRVGEDGWIRSDLAVLDPADKVYDSRHVASFPFVVVQ